MLLEKLLANQSLRPSADKSVAAPTPQLPYGWCHRECSTRTRRGQQGKSLHSAATDTTASDCSSYRIYKPMPQPATAPPIGSNPSSPLEVETVGNRDVPGLSGNNAVTYKRMNPQYEVCWLIGVRKKDAGWAREVALEDLGRSVSASSSPSTSSIFLWESCHNHTATRSSWSLIAADPPAISLGCEARRGVPGHEYLQHRKATTGYT